MKIAVLGLGSIGRRHAANFRALGCVVKTWDREPLARNADPAPCDTLAEALDGVAGVVIATPPDAHYQAAAGHLPQMIEKPLAVDAGFAERMLRMIKAPILVAYPWRHWPALQAMKRLLDEGRIGTVVSAHTEYGWDLRTSTNWADYRLSWMANPDRGGGCLLDTSHAIDLNRWLLGEIMSVAAIVETRVLEMAADDSADLMVRFASDAFGTLRLSLCTPVRGQIEIFGEHGVLAWYRSHGVTLNGNPTPHFSLAQPDINEMYLAEAAHFLDCIGGKVVPVCDGADGLRTLKVVDAARRSSANGQWVDV